MRCLHHVLLFCFFAHYTASTIRHPMVRNIGDPDIAVRDTERSKKCKTVPMNDRIECPVPGETMDSELCSKVGCCMNDTASDYPDMCFFTPDYRRYIVMRVANDEDHVNVTLSVNNPMRVVNTARTVYVSVTYHSKEVAKVSLQRSRFPGNYIPWEPYVPVLGAREAYLDAMYNVEALMNGMLTITRKNEDGDINKGVPVFRTNFSYLTFDEQYMQITLFLSSSRVYGFAGYLSPLQLKVPSSFYFFNRGVGPEHDGRGRGSHPMYICLEDGGTAHGVFLFNSNPAPFLRPNPSMTFRVFGGKLDFYVFMGPTIEDVVRQYLELVGKPAMPPYWGLGFHLSREGYKTLNNVENVLKRNVNEGVPVEAIWNTMEYTKHHLIFTLSSAFDQVREFVKNIHDDHRYYVVDTPPFVRKPTGNFYYLPYDQGVLMNVFVKNSSMGSTSCTVDYEAGVNASYVDFTMGNAADYWFLQLNKFHQMTSFDGVWLTHTSPWCSHVDPEQCSMTSTHELPRNYPEERLNRYTLCMEDIFSISKHYDVHNLYGYYAAKATYMALKRVIRRRPFIVAGATFAGQGKWSGHWTGDTLATWESMRESIPMLLTFNLLGMPFVGADICGTKQNATVELCARWHSLGAFYPFARNHNGAGFVDQDPQAMGSAVVGATIRSLHIRYLLLPYLYTLFYRNTVHSEPVMRAMFYEFPEDENTYTIDTQFMWGPALLICPILYPKVKYIDPYVPRGLWYSYYTGGIMIVNEGQKMRFPVTSVDIILLIRGGYIIPFQQHAQVTNESRNQPFGLGVAADENGEAEGELFWDDGISYDTVENGDYVLYKFSLLKELIRATVIHHGVDTGLRLVEVNVMGIMQEPVDVRLDDSNGIVMLPFVYNSTDKTLQITMDNYRMEKDFIIKWRWNVKVH
ncbi:lysosomal alpha-glucosidase-like isoform X2 [Ornithodoros turicata]|uniref:lysosomal alpha-glucosidase-like isoform X2 n=1 Tax=Ornithodoros turicata TaxID=34597 RepID=UPI00313A3B1B